MLFIWGNYLYRGSLCVRVCQRAEREQSNARCSAGRLAVVIYGQCGHSTLNHCLKCKPETLAPALLHLYSTLQPPNIPFKVTVTTTALTAAGFAIIYRDVLFIFFKILIYIESCVVETKADQA